MGRSLTILSLNQKLEIIKHLKSKTRTKRELASEHSCDVSTIYRILSSEDKIRKIALTNPKRKRSRTSVYHDVDKALTDWFHKTRLQNTTINSKILLTKAQQFATKLKSSFKPNYGWQKRENVKFKKFQNVDSDNPAEIDLPKFILENAIPKEEVKDKECGFIDKVLTSRRETKDEHVADIDEVMKSLIVLRKFMLNSDLDVSILEQVEEKVFKFKKSWTEATTNNEVWPSLLCSST